MRVFYLDPALLHDVGHHANYCRYLAGEFRARGVATLVFGYGGMVAPLQTELGAAAHFRVNTYTDKDDDPFCPWLTGFDTMSRMTHEDLDKLPRLESTDLVFMTSVWPIQMSAMIEWWQALPPARRPTAVLDCIGTGLEVRQISERFDVSVPDPRIDPRAVLFRYVARRLPRGTGARFHLTTFGEVPSRLFQQLLSYPVGTLASPFRAVAPLRNRAGTRPITVAVLGHQRSRKGFDLMPDIARELLRARPDIRLFIQSVGGSDIAAAQQRLRDLAATNQRLVIDEGAVSREWWAKLVGISDLIVCPYRPEAYVAGFSAVLNEALANGIPVVVPAGTTLATFLQECGGCGTSFERFDPAAIVAATSQALDNFEHFANLAHATAVTWPQVRGPGRVVDELLALARAPGSDLSC
ncbi:MAG TPA: glycosyltransferase [Stellaceae bacterium]|nr:glycosyltransferase [Stellaceae bacterium]